MCYTHIYYYVVKKTKGTVSKMRAVLFLTCNFYRLVSYALSKFDITIGDYTGLRTIFQD